MWSRKDKKEGTPLIFGRPWRLYLPILLQPSDSMKSTTWSCTRSCSAALLVSLPWRAEVFADGMRRRFQQLCCAVCINAICSRSCRSRWFMCSSWSCAAPLGRCGSRNAEIFDACPGIKVCVAHALAHRFQAPSVHVSPHATRVRRRHLALSGHEYSRRSLGGSPHG